MIIICCGGLLLVMALVYLPTVLLRKGFSLACGCVGNGIIVIVAGILLLIFIEVAAIDVCQIWLVGDALCSLTA